jgi:hypothetical protein
MFRKKLNKIMKEKEIIGTTGILIDLNYVQKKIKYELGRF